MIALDTETTGLLRPSASELHLQPFMIELAALKINDDFEVVDELVTLVRPPVPVSDEITKITGITNDMLIGKPSFVHVYPELCDFFLGEKVMFAHNCSFDADIIMYELMRMDKLTKFPWPCEQICTVEASFAIHNKRLKLGQLYEIATGKSSFPSAHRAKADVLAMIECMKFLKENKFI